MHASQVPFLQCQENRKLRKDRPSHAQPDLSACVYLPCTYASSSSEAIEFTLPSVYPQPDKPAGRREDRLRHRRSAPSRMPISQEIWGPWWVCGWEGKNTRVGWNNANSTFPSFPAMTMDGLHSSIIIITRGLSAKRWVSSNHPFAAPHLPPYQVSSLPVSIVPYHGSRGEVSERRD